MKKTELKSFDITTYDIEIEYNKKIAPLEKRIERADDSHEKKSLKAHKDFLAKEKKSTQNIKTLEDKVVLKNQRIEKATENKLVKFQKKENHIKHDLETYKQEVTQHTKEETDQLHIETKNLQEGKQQDIEKIKAKYAKNVTSYVERLDTYNSNFNNNKRIFQDQYNDYTRKLNENIIRIEEIKKQDEQLLKEHLEEYINSKSHENEQRQTEIVAFERNANADLTAFRKQSNLNKKQVDDFVNSLKVQFEERYKSSITKLQEKRKKLSASYDMRKLLINKDLEINNEKLSNQIAELEKSKNKKTIKSINMKKDLFNIRAKTVTQYEEALLLQKIGIIDYEIAYLQQTLESELNNLKKLRITLYQDEDHSKVMAEFLHNKNIELNNKVYESEQTNSDYLIKHQKLKAEFIQNYINQFIEIKQRLIESNQQQIEQLKTINSELDDIDKFLDTVDPLKEIELNHLRESIEISEIEERYNIKFAKQEHEIKLLQNSLRQDIQLQELNTKDLLSENNKNITIAKAKETMDKLIAAARLKRDKAEEIYKLRQNSTKLERNILESSYETELKKADIKKDLVQLQLEKEYALQTKEIDIHINNYKQEANYKSEVINKQLEEDLLNLQEHIRTIEVDRDSFTQSVNQLIKQEETNIDTQIIAVNTEMDHKLTQVEEALSREIKEPSLNIARGEVIIKERLSKFDTNDAFYQEFIASTKSLLQSENLTPEQLKQVILNNQSIYQKSFKYIDNTYDVLVEAVNFMKDLEQRALLNQISSTADQAKTKRLQRQLTKLKQEQDKQIQVIAASNKDHKLKIKASIQANFTTIEKQKDITEEQLSLEVNKMYSNIFSLLQDLQQNIGTEVQTLYAPLTKNDQEIIDNAHENAKKAKELIEKEREKRINPINAKLGEYIKEKEQEKQHQIREYNNQINTLKHQISDLKEKALKDVKDVTEQQVTALKEIQEQKEQITAALAPQIAQEIREIGQLKLDLEEDYYKRLKQLEEKDTESTKIFEYEDRIYNIALENAESRYNDTLIKTEAAHQKQIDEHKDEREIIKGQTNRNIERINKELRDATTEFEKNIFTVRPKYEESIGDAQKAIDDEQMLKESRRKDLIEMNRKMSDSIEQNLYTSFKEAYDKLKDNLHYYIEKYKVIEQEYNQMNKEHSSKIIQINDDIKDYFFSSIEKKHETTNNELQKIHNN